MTDATALELRHVRLAELVTLRPASLGPTPDGGVEEGVFVALDDSPPVRTVLAVVEGGRRRALEVAWVVEVTERDDAGGPATRGFYGRWLGDEALERAGKVGTEHLEDGTPVVQPVVYDNSAVLDVSDSHMAMPAPVVLLDGSDEDEDGREDEDGDDGSSAASSSDDIESQPTVHYPEHAYHRATIIDPDFVPPEAAAEGQTVSYSDYQRSEAEQAASEDAEGAEGDEAADAAETSTDSGEAPSESSDGDASESRSKGRKKRRRRR
jgi:hypothetical protein